MENITYHHCIACWRLLKCEGRPLKILCMEDKASRAVPSTTSMTQSPAMLLICCAASTATAPPMLCPIRMIGSSLSSVILFAISAASL